MSYDLIVRPHGATVVPTSAAIELPGADAFERIEAQGRLTFCLNGDDAEMARFVYALLQWAERSGHLVEDPQLGAPLRRLGQLTWLAPSSKGKTIATQLKNLTADRLAAHGFSFQKPRTVVRRRNGIRQGFELLPPRRGRTSVNVFWALELAEELNPGAYTGVARLHRLADADVTGAFDEIAVRLFDFGLPYLDRYASPAALLEGVESGALAVSAAFGPSEDWQVYYRGLCLHAVGRVPEAIEAMQDLVENHSLHPHQRHAERMRAEGREDFAARADAEFEKVRASGKSWVQRDRREQAERLIAAWSG